MNERVERVVRRRYVNSDLAYALELAADFLENEEWPEDDGGATVAAYREAAKRARIAARNAKPPSARVQPLP